MMLRTEEKIIVIYEQCRFIILFSIAMLGVGSGVVDECWQSINTKTTTTITKTKTTTTPTTTTTTRRTPTTLL